MLYIATFELGKSYYMDDEVEKTHEIRLVEADDEDQVKDALEKSIKAMVEPYYVSYWVEIHSITPIINARDVLGLTSEDTTSNP